MGWGRLGQARVTLTSECRAPGVRRGPAPAPRTHPCPAPLTRYSVGAGVPESCPTSGVYYESAALSAREWLDERRRALGLQPEHIGLLLAWPDKRRWRVSGHSLGYN